MYLLHLFSDPFISNEALFAILNELESMLLVGSIQSKHLTVAKQITMDLYNRDLNLSPFVKKSESALGFLLFLFKISCRRIVEDKEDGEISEAWNLGVSALSKAHGIESQEFKKIFNDFCTIVSFELFNRFVYSITFFIIFTVFTLLSFLMGIFISD